MRSGVMRSGVRRSGVRRSNFRERGDLDKVRTAGIAGDGLTGSGELGTTLEGSARPSEKGVAGLLQGCPSCCVVDVVEQVEVGTTHRPGFVGGGAGDRVVAVPHRDPSPTGCLGVAIDEGVIETSERPLARVGLNPDSCEVDPSAPVALDPNPALGP